MEIRGCRVWATSNFGHAIRDGNATVTMLEAVSAGFALLLLVRSIFAIYCYFFFFIILKPRVEWCRSTWALNTSPPWNRSTFLLTSCSLIVGGGTCFTIRRLGFTIAAEIHLHYLLLLVRPVCFTVASKIYMSTNFRWILRKMIKHIFPVRRLPNVWLRL